jgi:hypothetical protein
MEADCGPPLKEGCWCAAWPAPGANSSVLGFVSCAEAFTARTEALNRSADISVEARLAFVVMISVLSMLVWNT